MSTMSTTTPISIKIIKPFETYPIRSDMFFVLKTKKYIKKYIQKEVNMI